jgi:hypothetical protein
MRETWEALQLDGIEMSYGQFRTYVWRIRKKGVPTAVKATASVIAPGSDAGSVPPQTVVPASPSAVNVRDPLVNTREAERKRVVFDYRPELADPSKLI